jgi:nucleoside-diphosphate-sugar epimerase
VIEEVAAAAYYGTAYQDMAARVPDISAARNSLGWEPHVGMREALQRTMAYYVQTQRRAPAAARGAAETR